MPSRLPRSRRTLRRPGPPRFARPVPLAAFAASVLLLSAVWPERAAAHAIESSLERVEALREGLVLESRFSTGEPVVGASVRLVRPGGGPAVELGQSDANGRFTFQLPDRADGTWELQVDGGAGHRDFLDLPVQQGRLKLDQISEAPRPATAALTSPILRHLLVFGGLGTLACLLAAGSGWRLPSRRR